MEKSGNNLIKSMYKGKAKWLWDTWKIQSQENCKLKREWAGTLSPHLCLLKEVWWHTKVCRDQITCLPHCLGLVRIHALGLLMASF